jgi:hypothetical protein
MPAHLPAHNILLLHFFDFIDSTSVISLFFKLVVMSSYWTILHLLSHYNRCLLHTEAVYKMEESALLEEAPKVVIFSSALIYNKLIMT